MWLLLLGVPLWLVVALFGDEMGLDIKDVFWGIVLIVVVVFGLIVYEPIINLMTNGLSGLGFENPKSIIANAWKLLIIVPFWDWILGIDMGRGLRFVSLIITLSLISMVFGFVVVKYEEWFDKHENSRDFVYLSFGGTVMLLLGRMVYYYFV